VSSVTSTISAAAPELASRHLHATLCDDTRSMGAAPYLPTRWQWCHTSWCERGGDSENEAVMAVVW
jgi:hypothetical protein